MSQLTRQNSRTSNARTPAQFTIYEDPPPPEPMRLFFPTLPNVRVELVSAIQAANPITNPSVPSRALQVNRWSPPALPVRTWSLESGSRQMHYAYETRSWHRASPTSSSSEISGQEEAPTTDSPDVYAAEEDARSEEELQAANSPELDAVVGDSVISETISTGSLEPQPRQRKRDRFRRFGKSIFHKIKDLGKDKEDREDRGPRGGLRRAFTVFPATRRG